MVSAVVLIVAVSFVAVTSYVLGQMDERVKHIVPKTLYSDTGEWIEKDGKTYEVIKRDYNYFLVNDPDHDLEIDDVVDAHIVNKGVVVGTLIRNENGTARISLWED